MLETCPVIKEGDFPRALEHLREAQAAARAAGDSSLLARLLFQQAGIFLCVNEFATAARCFEELLLIGGRSADPEVAAMCENARAALAFNAARQANALARRGRVDAAAAVRTRALQWMPGADAASPFEALHLVIHARALLGDVAGARAAAALYMRRARSRPREPARMAQFWLAMGLFHQHAGRPAKAVVRYQRALAAVQAVLHPIEYADLLQLLAAAYAGCGQHATALAWLRRVREIRTAARLEPERLRLRIAARDLDREAQRLQRLTESLHAQRLAVFGRLMAQIYHALGMPLAAAHRALEAGLAERPEAGPEALKSRLREVVSSINEAALLTRQLRMFSYRATPQISALDLPLALQEAWRGVAVGRAQPAPPLALRGTAPPQVSGDAQRLAVLLRIVFIELERMSGGATPRVRIGMRGEFVRTTFECDLSSVHAGIPSVGYTLCEELAGEMQGGLRRLEAPWGEVALALELPVGP